MQLDARCWFYDEELQSLVDEVARSTSIAVRIEDEAIKRKRITDILQIGNVDLLREGCRTSFKKSLRDFRAQPSHGRS